MTIKEAIDAAQVADDAFEAAIKAEGYKSRWDWPYPHKTGSNALFIAYRAKIDADQAMHAAFERSRAQA